MQERTYIEYDNARITKNDGILLKVEMYDGRIFDDVEARRLFPLTGLQKYITLLDIEGVEQAIIRDLSNLTPESRKVVEDVLNEYYLVPKITSILSIVEKYGKLLLKVETDNGPHSFEIKNTHSDIKMLYDGRVMIKDSSDNRYDIPDLAALGKESMRKLNPYL
ncbi:MAG: DUF1854 domain-containing protein [Eubacteriales bacterium]